MAGLMPGAVDGWLGVRQIGGGSSEFNRETVIAGEALALGNVVRISANNTVIRALASAAAGVQGTIGVVAAAAGFGAQVPVITDGKATVLMEAGLVGLNAPAAGRTIWVSPNAPAVGRATTVRPSGPPAEALCVGIIKDATRYAIDQTVVADVDPHCELDPCLDGKVNLLPGGLVDVGFGKDYDIIFPVPFPVGVIPQILGLLELRTGELRCGVGWYTHRVTNLAFHLVISNNGPTAQITPTFFHYRACPPPPITVPNSANDFQCSNE